MCGITGAVWSDQRQSIAPEVLAKMTDAISHRGPNDSQTWISTSQRDAYGNPIGVGLGFRRLSIIDLEGARQPMSNEDGTVRMVFNGEIYNYQTLRRRLEGRGHHFATEGRWRINPASVRRPWCRLLQSPQRHVCDWYLGCNANAICTCTRSHWSKTTLLCCKKTIAWSSVVS